MPFRRSQEIYSALRELGVSGEVWALFSELHNLQNMHPDIVAAELKRSRDRESLREKRATKEMSRESHDNPSKESTKENIYNNINPEGGCGGKPKTVSEEFEAIWKLYPCKKSKGRAAKAFARWRKTVPLEVITAGVKRLLAENRDPNYWPYFASWLNDNGWLDEPAKPKADNVTTFKSSSGVKWLDVSTQYIEKWGRELALKKYNEDLDKGEVLGWLKPSLPAVHRNSA
jgi:hypothetical protein